MQLNPYIVVPLVTWLIAQWLKFSIAAFKEDINFRYLYASGGMPSVHSAVVTSLFLTALFREGSQSPLVGITAVFAAIVIYDSLGVRRSTGEQAVVLNAIVEGLESQKVSFASNVAKVREVLGHQPREVFWGIVTGAVIAFFGSLSHVSQQLSFFAVTPKGLELVAYGAVLVLALIALVTVMIRYGKRFDKAGKAAGKVLIWAALATAITGFGIVLAQYEKVSIIGSRWPVYVTYLVLIWLGYYVVRTIRQLPGEIHDATRDRKRTWLNRERAKEKKKRRR